MVSIKQKLTAKNIKKAQAKWRSMSHRQHTQRKKPGTQGTGEYYRIVVRPKEQFTTFRYHDVGRKGHLQRLAGKRSSGSWATQAWLVSKHDAELKNETLVPTSSSARQFLKTLDSKPRHVKGDVFRAKDRSNIPEKDKPTRKQKQAWRENIKKAQEVRR